MQPRVYHYRRIVQAKLFIDSNYQASINLNRIADEASFSKFHFIRLFKSIYGKTPHQYLIWVRLEKARSLLQQGLAVSEVCSEVGFESVNSFVLLFKRNFATTPSRYQQAWVERQSAWKVTPLKFIPSCFAYQKGWLKK